MPTPTGLPKVGEVWDRKFGYPNQEEAPLRFVVLERSRGDYWALRVYIQNPGHNRPHRVLWVDAAYWMSQGEFEYVGPAGPKTKKRLGLG